MREILFRAKRADNGEWICGFPIFDFADCSLKRSGKCVCEHNGELLCFYGWIDELHEYDEIEVIPETVCQYTGLTDKAGKRFEGDIFQASDGDCIQRYIIVWNEDSLEWSAECVGNPNGTLPLSEFSVGEIEVIGNILDNPELIGE